MVYYIILITSIVCIQRSLCDESLYEKWHNFKATNNKSYETAEQEEFRLKIFLKNLYDIDEHNSRYKQGLVSYELEINHFADYTDEDFNNYAHGILEPTTEQNVSLYVKPENITVPESIDWRTHNVIPPVKNQGNCGSCWAFSAICALEALTNIKHKKLVSLSEQNLVDCSKINHGCHGGWPLLAYLYIKKNKGIDTEKSYPYEGKQGKCRYNPKNKGATVSGVKRISRGKESDVKAVVGTIGPVSVAISVTRKLYFYKRGIFDEPKCKRTRVNHAVNVIGYGTEKGVDYWLVRNSWGPKWGEKGYIRIRRNSNNMCNIASVGVFPIVP